MTVKNNLIIYITKILVILIFSMSFGVVIFLTLITKFINTFSVATYNYAENVILKSLSPYHYIYNMKDVFDESQFVEDCYKIPSILLAIYELITDLRSIFIPFSGLAFIFMFCIMTKLFAVHDKTFAIFASLSFSIYAISHNLHALSISRAELGTVYTFLLLYIILKSYIKAKYDKSSHMLISIILTVQLFTHYTNLMISIIIVLTYTCAIYVTNIYKHDIRSPNTLRSPPPEYYFNLIIICVIIAYTITYNRYVEVGLRSFLPTLSTGILLQLSNLRNMISSIFTQVDPLAGDVVYDQQTVILALQDFVFTRLIIVLSLCFIFLDALKKRLRLGLFILALVLTTYFGYNIYNILRMLLLGTTKLPLSAGLIAIILPLYGIYYIDRNASISKLRKHSYLKIFIIILMFSIALCKIAIYISYGKAGNQLNGINYLIESKILDLFHNNNEIKLTGDEVLLYYIKYYQEGRFNSSNLIIRSFNNKNLSHNFIILSPKLKTFWINVWGPVISTDSVINMVERFKYEYKISKLFDSPIIKLFYIK